MKQCGLAILMLLLSVLPIHAQNDTVNKTVCTLAVGYDDVDEIKADLLTSAKREVVNELFGELIIASTAVENFVVTSDQIRASSIGFVRVDGDAKFYNGDSFVEACVTISAYVTEDDLIMFEPELLENKYCDADDDMTTSELIAYVKDEVIINALTEWDPKLKGADRESLLQLVQKITYWDSGFITDTQTYCTEFTGSIVPVEVMAYREIEQSPEVATEPRQIVLGTFDKTRVGGLSIDYSEHFEEVRVALREYFPQITIESFAEISAETLEGVNILFLSSATSNNSAIEPLSKIEQDSMLNFVQSGGCAILLPNNDRFAANADKANESLVDIFGLDVDGTLTGEIATTIVDVQESPILSGKFGTISSFTQNYPGGITNDNRYAKSLATNNLGSALSIIPQNAIAEGSGSVVVFSDLNSFLDKDYHGLFFENESLFLNTIDHCISSVMENVNP